MLNVIIVGYGSIAKKHVKVLRELYSSLSIYALRSNKNVEEEKSLTNIFHLSELPARIDFVIISNPTSEHYETIENLISLKVPLFIEKPLLASLSDAKVLEEKIKENRILTYVACNFRFHPAINKLREKLQDTPLVEVNIYAGSFLPEWRPGRDYRHIYSARKSQGGGVHLDLIHEIDYSYFLFGKPSKTIFYGRKKSNLEIDSFDVAHYVLEYEKLSVFITLNYYRKSAKRQIEVVWEDDEWTLDLLTNKIISSTGQVLFQEPYSIMDTYKEQMKYFVDCIKSGNEPMNQFSEALDVLNICLNDEYA